VLSSRPRSPALIRKHTGPEEGLNPMAEATAGPVCFRISAGERGLLELLAEARGVTLSSLVRDLTMDMARALVEKAGGTEAVAEQARRQRRERLLAEDEELTRRVQAVLAEGNLI